MTDDVVYPPNFPSGEGGLSITNAALIAVAATGQAAADELRNYGKRINSPGLVLFVVTSMDDVEIANVAMPADAPWCVVSGADTNVERAMTYLRGQSVTFAKAVGMVNDQRAIHPKKLLGTPT